MSTTPAPLPPLTHWRFAWRTKSIIRAGQIPGGLPDMETATADRHAAAFRSARVEFRLGLSEVAQGWGLELGEVLDLEQGMRRFLSPADFWAALQQLFCWGCERHAYVGMGSGHGQAPP